MPSAPPENEPEEEPAEDSSPNEGEPTAEGGSVCVLAYHDRNADTFRQAETEEMLPNAVFYLGDTAGLLGQYTTNGIGEPYCFTGLTPGTYRVRVQPPPGYIASGSGDVALGMGQAERMEVVIGIRPDEAAEVGTDPAEPDAQANTETNISPLWQVLRWVARIGGAAMLMTAVGLAGAFVVSRNRH